MSQLDNISTTSDLNFHKITTILSTDRSLIESISSKIPTNLSLAQVVFVGTPGVGKTSIIKDIHRFGSISIDDEERISDWASIFVCVDTDGYDLETNDLKLFELIRNADVVVQVVDIDASVRRSDAALAIIVQKFEKPYIAVLNKIDLYQGPKLKKLSQKASLDIRSEVLLVSARSGDGRASLIYAISKKLNEIFDDDVELRIDVLYKQIVETNAKLQRRSVCERIIREKAYEAAAIGASDRASGAQLLALHALMIHLIAEQFGDDRGVIAPDTFDTRVSFFLNAATQSVKDLIPNVLNSLTAIHAMYWTNRIGELALDYFEQMVDNNSLTTRIAAIVHDLEQGGAQ